MIRKDEIADSLQGDGTEPNWLLASTAHLDTVRGPSAIRPVKQ